jgi:hypothetical protein
MRRWACSVINPPPTTPSYPTCEAALSGLAQARDNRALFIDAMSDPLRRRIAFNVVERNCRERFAEGEDGIKLYRELLADVRRSGIEDAANEFEQRFEPMLVKSFGSWGKLFARRDD